MFTILTIVVFILVVSTIGFTLRFAGSKHQKLFQSYLLLSPYPGPDAPNFRPGAGGWANTGSVRLIGLSILNAFGVCVFLCIGDELPTKPGL